VDIAIPAAPAGILTLLAFFAPYPIGALNGILPFVRKPWQKKTVSVIFALVLAAVVIIAYQNITGRPIGDPWMFGLLSIVVAQASYTLITRGTASAVERAAEKPARVDGAHNE
jgi:hypothetical protein